MYTRPRRGQRVVAPILFAFVTLAATVASRCAHAHIVAQPDQGKAGSYFETSLKVPHGCDGSSTVALRVGIPDGVLSIKPQMKPGWTVSIVTRSIDPPLKLEHGMTIDKAVRARRFISLSCRPAKTASATGPIFPSKNKTGTPFTVPLLRFDSYRRNE
jgi:hypothetical protein